jgi:HEPN domain-containing protein
VSPPRPEGSEQALVLARRAAGDATAVRKLAAASDIADEMVGLHAQQAVEKWLKAVIVIRGLELAPTNDIGRLVRTLEKGGGEPPAVADRLDELTQYAAPFHGEYLLELDPLNREAAVALVDEVGRWANAELESANDA